MMDKKGDNNGKKEVIVDRLMELIKKLKVKIKEYKII
jgi:hypothetical protein